MSVLDQALGNPQAGQHQVARASALLPAAGAWDAAPLELICIGMEAVLLVFSYTRAVAGGDMRFRVEVSLFGSAALTPAGMPEWARATVLDSGVVVSGTDTLSNIQRGRVEYGSTGAGAETFVYGPLALKKLVTRIRVTAQESGVIGNPGTAAVYAAFSPI